MGKCVKKGICSAKKPECQEGRPVAQSSKSRSSLQDDELTGVPLLSHPRTAQRPPVSRQPGRSYGISFQMTSRRIGTHRYHVHNSDHNPSVVAISMLTKRSPCFSCASPQHTKMHPSPAPATRKSCRNATSSSMSRASTMEQSTLTITNVGSITSSLTSSPQN